VQRALALFVGVALLATADQVSRLHTHVYIGHEHPEHQHGLAAHDHDQAVVHEDEDEEGPHVESCDPGRHEVSLTLGCAPAMPRVSVHAEAAQLPVLHRLVLLRIIGMATDARAHGPPLVPSGPSRAPPHICLA
jgi:hypothetical protein